LSKKPQHCSGRFGPKSDDFSERFAAAHGQWTSSALRGEFKTARELASKFPREAENAGRFVEAGVALRGLEPRAGALPGSALAIQQKSKQKRRALRRCRLFSGITGAFSITLNRHCEERSDEAIQ
jgi:hypothetical protein